MTNPPYQENAYLYEQLEEHSRTLEHRVEERTHQLQREIRERRQAEEALRASEERWQLVLQGNNDGIWDCNLLTQETFRSPRWYEILGYQDDDIGTGAEEWTQRIHPDDRERILHCSQAYLKQQIPYYVQEYRLRCKNGTYKWVQDRGQAVWDETGQAIRIVGSMHDITERKQVEEDLRQREESLRRQQAALAQLTRQKAFHDGDLDIVLPLITKTAAQALNVERVGVWFFDADHSKIHQANLYELTPDRHSSGQELWVRDFPTYFQALETDEFIVVDDVSNNPLTRELLEQCFQPHQIASILDVPIQSGGKTIGGLCYEHVRHPRRWTVDEQNFASHLASMISLAIAVRNHQRAETALRLSEERWHLALRGNNDGIWDWDLRTNQVFLSARWKEMLGYGEEELPSHLEAWLTRMHPEDLDRVLAIHRAHLEGETPYYIAEFRLRCKDGHYKWILSRGQALWDESGVPVRIVGSHTDISDRKQAEENLRSAKLLADAANKAKSEFLANMSHELRTPLTAILGLAEVLLDEGGKTLTEKQQMYLATISQSGHHLLELINDLLDLAKIESGRMELNLAITEVRRLCDASLAFVREQAKQKGIYLSLRIASDVDTIWADERRIRQVLINLLSNAVKFTPAEGSVCLRVEGDPNHEVVHFRVVDTGIGIASESMQRLFQPFVQLESSFSRRYAGTGLGLALVRRVVDLHQGSISVASAMNWGSQFTVTLPWTNGQSELQSEPDPLLHPSWLNLSSLNPQFATDGIDSSGFGPILLIEDNEINGARIRADLERHGFQVTIACNGLEALQITQVRQPALVLLDIQIPEMDGLQMIRYLRAGDHLPTVPIIAITSLMLPGDRDRYLAAGVNAYLVKPLQFKHLLQAMEPFIGDGHSFPVNANLRSDTFAE
ncbi:hypothetical protein BST81_12565 [Leptolyngbya sp. 'hensonii']|uniref:PAS domain-containing protein n=1 Tax=Leptolyngbya sp. 'hensonii' TaxID=1922337 RepID=UPI0009501DFD|nr:PAS domain-containing protein [Leptolyngbya sp. 'hensonii']OLP17886.1 hypothetical protein BST81_12565 [Leptolyngbya sp. 'hensonii']